MSTDCRAFPASGVTFCFLPSPRNMLVDFTFGVPSLAPIHSVKHVEYRLLFAFWLETSTCSPGHVQADQNSRKSSLHLLGATRITWLHNVRRSRTTSSSSLMFITVEKGSSSFLDV